MRDEGGGVLTCMQKQAEGAYSICMYTHACMHVRATQSLHPFHACMHCLPCKGLHAAGPGAAKGVCGGGEGGRR